jgi:hypothetical protein
MATLTACGAQDCQARFRLGGRPFQVGPLQGRDGQRVTLSVERADPTAFATLGGAAGSYGPLIAVLVLTLLAVVYWRVYRPGAPTAAPSSETRAGS